MGSPLLVSPFCFLNTEIISAVALSLLPRTLPPHILGTLHQLGLLQNLHQRIELFPRQLAVVDTQLGAE